MSTPGESFTVLNMVGSSGKIFLKGCSPTLFYMPRTQWTCKQRWPGIIVVTSLEARVAVAVVVVLEAVVPEVAADLTVFKRGTKCANPTTDFGLAVAAPTSLITTESVDTSITALPVLRKLVPKKATKPTTANQMAGPVVLEAGLAAGLPSPLSLLASNYSILGAV